MRRWQYECERAGGDCAARVEALALRMPYARAVRAGHLLKLFTRAGPVEFADAADGHACTDHRYLGLLEPALQHLVWQRRPEGVRFLAISDHDGEQSVFESLTQALMGLLHAPDQMSKNTVSFAASAD